MAVYARAPFFIVQAALDRLADGGRIINISSAAATKPVTAAPVYSMAKAAINNLDRKSTRLNSSHPSISYAVFCLKKKKHQRFIFNTLLRSKYHTSKLSLTT